MNVGSDLTHADLARLVTRSVDLIDRHQSPSGAYPASPTFSAYQGYAWLRDGAFIAEGMSRVADPAGPSAFHAWCARVVGARAAQVTDLTNRASRGLPVTPADMLPTRFTLDGSNGTDAWWDHQLDGYGTWLWSLHLHLNRHSTDIPGTHEAIRIATHYLTTFWHHPCYDWWEEHVDQRHVSTLAAIHAGLRAAIALGALTRPLTEAAEEAIEGISTLVAKEGVVGSTTAPGSVAGQTTTPEGVTGQTMAPQGVTDQTTAPQGVTGQATAPQGVTDQTMAPRGVTDQTTAPQSVTGQATAPQGVTDQTTAPQGVTDQTTAPQGVTGQATAPQGVTDQTMAPEGVAGQATEKEGWV
ncbi:glycoside hydrolase family 15 protein, partial [Acrocarpospora macrocephala]